jgi:hypothetical protein
MNERHRPHRLHGEIVLVERLEHQLAFDRGLEIGRTVVLDRYDS